jgi:hypothetical protein
MLYVENKFDAPLGPKQLERYLDLGHVALVSRCNHSVPTEVLNHPDYHRPSEGLGSRCSSSYRRRNTQQEECLPIVGQLEMGLGPRPAERSTWSKSRFLPPFDVRASGPAEDTGRSHAHDTSPSLEPCPGASVLLHRTLPTRKDRDTPPVA